MKAFLIFIIFLGFSNLYSQETYRENKIPRRVKKVCQSLISLDKTESQFVGFAASQSESWPYYLKLKKKANSKVLVELTNHPSPIIRFYAFEALVEKNPLEVIVAMRKNENDTVQISYMAGCIKSNHVLIDLVVSQSLDYLKENKSIPEEDIQYLEQRQQVAVLRFERI